jgi:hypothetical protein
MTSIEYIDNIDTFFTLLRVKTLEILNLGYNADVLTIISILNESDEYPKEHLMDRLTTIQDVIPVIGKHLDVTDLSRQLNDLILPL